MNPNDTIIPEAGISLQKGEVGILELCQIGNYFHSINSWIIKFRSSSVHEMFSNRKHSGNLEYKLYLGWQAS